MKLRDYQVRGVQCGIDASKNEQRILLTAPTGVGKSYAELATQAAIPGSVIVSPSLEIIKGLCAKRGLKPTQTTAEQHGIFTPLRLLSGLISGLVKRPTFLVVDEAHHDAANTYALLYAQCKDVSRVGYTATPYRINPKETEAFLSNWDEQIELISWADAQARELICIPDIKTIPLVDDDILELVAGDLSIRAVESATKGVIDALYQHLWGAGFFSGERVSVITMPGTDTLEIFKNWCQTEGNLVLSVTAQTSEKQRMHAMKRCLDKLCALLQINVLGEGVDFPVRLMADCSPTMSPTRFIQRFGRVCRPLAPGESPGVYYCFNRNLQHHGYLLADVLPPAVIREQTEAFPTFTRRAGLRSIGVESFGKIKPAEVRTASGDTVHLYVVNGIEGGEKSRYALIVHPMEMAPFWFRKDSTPDARWEYIRKPINLSAVAAKSKAPITAGQLGWWQKPGGAARYGLDVDQPLDGRKFEILPILADCNLSLRGLK